MSSRPWPLMLTTTLAALAAAPAADAGAAGCSWLRAPSAQQPPCPGGLADSPWAMAHGGPFAQDSSPLPGPTAADRPKARRVLLGGAALGAVFSPRYKDGRRVVWSLGGTLDYRGYVWKVDERTAQERSRR